MSNLFWLTDAQMERLKPFFPKSHSTPRVDDKRVLSGIIFINRNGFAAGGSFMVPGAQRVPLAPPQPEKQATVRSEAATGAAPVKSQKTTVNVYGADDDAEVVESIGPNGLKIIDVYLDGRIPEKSQRPYPRH